jgi:hypothetical protein
MKSLKCVLYHVNEQEVGWHIHLRASTYITLRYIQCCGSGIQCLFDPWIRDPGWVKNQDPDSGSGMNNPDHISETLETVFWVKILKFFNADPLQKKFESMINIPDPQHWFHAFWRTRVRSKQQLLRLPFLEWIAEDPNLTVQRNRGTLGIPMLYVRLGRNQK